MKRIVSLLLIVVLSLSMIPISMLGTAAAVTDLADTGVQSYLAAVGLGTIPTEVGFVTKLNQLRQKYPNGTSWAGVYYENGTAKAWTCHAYAVQMFYEMFGVEFYNSAFYNNKDYTFGTICAGDIVRINNNSHSIFITKVTEDKIYFTDGNYDNANGIRWDAYYTVAQLRSIFSYKYHLSGNTLTGNADLQHTIAYKGNGGTGSIASTTISVGGTLHVNMNTFTREGYNFSGYTVKRSFDDKWYTVGNGWQTASDIYDNGFDFYIFKQGASHSFGSGWTKGVTSPSTYTFYAQWLPENSTVEFFANYSGFNYMLGSDLGASYADYLKSSDTSVYQLSVDASNRLNNADSLKIVGSAAGSSGKEVRLYTSTNYSHPDGYGYTGTIGDVKDMVLRFWAKSSVNGATISIRWKNASAAIAETVTLTDSWAAYTVPVPKNQHMGIYLITTFDSKGTFWLNSLALCDGTSCNRVTPETALKTNKSQNPVLGGCMASLPTPSRDGYDFLGWYTAANGGDKVTSSTPINETRLRLYAHWAKKTSDTPVSTVIFNGHTYELYDNAMGWSDAKTFCSNKGGYLVTIGSDEENAVVAEMLKDGQKYSWIGLSFDKSAKKWKWVDGKTVSYNQWYSDKEGTSTTTEYYAMMYSMNLGNSKTYGKWADCNGVTNPASFYSYLNSVFVCEYDTVLTPTEETTEPTEETTADPTAETTVDPTDESVDPSAETTDSTGETFDPGSETGDPTAETTDPADETSDSTGETTDPAGESSEATEQTDETAQEASSEETAAPTEPPILLGDTDRDGIITIFDVTYLQRLLANLVPPSEEDIARGDADGDGKLAILDVTAIQRWLGRYEDKYPIGKVILLNLTS